MGTSGRRCSRGAGRHDEHAEIPSLGRTRRVRAGSAPGTARKPRFRVVPSTGRPFLCLSGYLRDMHSSADGSRPSGRACRAGGHRDTSAGVTRGSKTGLSHGQAPGFKRAASDSQPRGSTAAHLPPPEGEASDERHCGAAEDDTTAALNSSRPYASDRKGRSSVAQRSSSSTHHKWRA